MRKIRLTSLALMTMLIMVGVNLTSCSKKGTPEEEQNLGKGTYKATFVSKEGQVSHYSGEGLGKVFQVITESDKEISGKSSYFIAMIRTNNETPSFAISGLEKSASYSFPIPQTENFLDKIEKLKEGESLENYTISEKATVFDLFEDDFNSVFLYNVTLTMKKVTFLGSKKTNKNGEEITVRAYAIKGKIKGENEPRIDGKPVESAEVEFEIVDDMDFRMI